MPLDAWLLLVVSVGLGLAIEVAFVRAQRRRLHRAAMNRGTVPPSAPVPDDPGESDGPAPEKAGDGSSSDRPGVGA